MKKHRVVWGMGLALLLVPGAAPVRAQFPDDSIAQSHIDGNVPPKAVFDKLLHRDLQRYFQHNPRSPVKVEVEMLRDGPTQAGLSYPKFYVWVKVYRKGKLVEEGALRLAAVERKAFDVTSYFRKDQIKKDPEKLYQVFPAPVADRIKQKL